MAHWQKSIRDRVRNRSQPNVDPKVISKQLEDLVKPCVCNQQGDYRSWGMRERILNLPLMLAAGDLRTNRILSILKDNKI